MNISLILFHTDQAYLMMFEPLLCSGSIIIKLLVFSYLKESIISAICNVRLVKKSSHFIFPELHFNLFTFNEICLIVVG